MCLVRRAGAVLVCPGGVRSVSSGRKAWFAAGFEDVEVIEEAEQLEVRCLPFQPEQQAAAGNMEPLCGIETPVSLFGRDGRGARTGVEGQDGRV